MSDLVRNLRSRRVMVNGGNGNVYDIADEDCEQAADRIEALEAALRDQRQRLKDKIDTRLNNYLCEMKEGYDDSITGFNEAWDIVRAALAPEQDK